LPQNEQYKVLLLSPPLNFVIIVSRGAGAPSPTLGPSFWRQIYTRTMV
jgi:hypothetical protein